MGNAVIRKLK